MVDRDWSAHGLPSLCPLPPEATLPLLDHCVEQGYARIICLSCQSPDDAIAGRIAAYRRWCERRGMAAQIVRRDDGPDEPVCRARDACAEALAAGMPDGSAIFATTAMAAIGALRAMHESGRRPGAGLGLCTLNDAGLGGFLVPSLTAVEGPDPARLIADCLDWMLDRSAAWRGPLRLEGGAPRVVARESTCGPSSGHLQTAVV